MTEGQKKLFIVLLIGIVILFLLMSVRRGSGQIIVNEAGDIISGIGGIGLPAFNYTPGVYPIPSLPNFTGVESTLMSACCATCDTAEKPSYYTPAAPAPEPTPIPPAPVPPAAIAPAPKKTGGLGFSSSTVSTPFQYESTGYLF